jgi:ATP-dependent helicase/nuclease subunit B
VSHSVAKLPRMLSKPQLFERLAEGHAAGITVVTPGKRLAQALVLDFDLFQTNNNLNAWEAADILPFDAWVQRFYEEALYADAGRDLPPLLTSEQEQALWEEVLGDSGLLVVPQAAEEARRAWRLVHRWRIRPAAANEDAAAFAGWARKYESRTKGDVDAARLPELIASLLKQIKTPKLVVAYGFDTLAPQEKDFLSQFTLDTCGPEPVAGKVARRAFPSAKEELEAAASWARARLEAGKQRIGVVVPDLKGRRKEVVRVFARVMGTSKPVNVSLGMPLSQYPLVAQALHLIRFSHEELPFEAASKLLRSPFIGGAEAEMARRARLDAQIRREAPARIGLAKLIGLSEGCPSLRKLLETVFELKPTPISSPHDWARHFTRVLEAAGFPGERARNSDEFQTLRKWEETLSEFARLDRLSKKMSFREAISRIEYICADLFQPESGDAPVQVLEVRESEGLRFDALWVGGLTDEAWPPGARPNPFLPIAAQRGVPGATAESTLLHSIKVTEGWKAAAPEVVFSHPEMEGDRALIASPLIKSINPGKSEKISYPRHRDLIFAARRLESIPDGQAPALATTKPRGGTRILADQAACPFRAFARHRLAAEELGEATSGPDALVRGQMLHTLMKELWEELKGSDALQGDCSAAIERAAKIAAAELEEPLAGMERKRLARLARDWLEIEKERPAFRISKLEEKISLKVANLEISGRIDRMDELASGGHAVIDYKAGRPTPNDWMGARPEEPQLPLYALSSKEEVTAVAFARLKAGEMRFMGFSKNKNSIPLVRQAEGWDSLLAGWKKETDALGAGFAAGEARVDPKDGLATCRYCDLQTLCRVYEKVNALEEEEGGE